MIGDLTISYNNQIKYITENNNKELLKKEQEIKMIKQTMLKNKENINSFLIINRKDLKNLKDFYLNQQKISLENFTLTLENQHKIFTALLDKTKHEIYSSRLEIEELNYNNNNLEEIIQIKEFDTKEDLKRKDDKIQALNKKLTDLEKSLINEKFKGGKEYDSAIKQLNDANEKVKQFEANIEEYRSEISKNKKEKEELEKINNLTIVELKNQNQQLEAKLMQQINDLIYKNNQIENDLKLDIKEGEKKFKDLESKYDLDVKKFNDLVEKGILKSNI